MAATRGPPFGNNSSRRPPPVGMDALGHHDNTTTRLLRVAGGT
ncbi:hypothetical protein ACJBCE_24220 [Streptomyces sp. NBUL23]